MARNVEAVFELERTRKALRAARLLHDAGLLQDSLSRSYYAVLHAAKAALVSAGISVDAHDAVKRLFGQHMVTTERIEKEYAFILRQEQDDRLLADYDVTYAPEESQVAARIEDASRFLDRVVSYLQAEDLETQ